ncbi:hypothetical protein PC116_g6022 [Phytophthora cactorum]|nr:hypothetical protein PC128_g2791 [Phytophthora cactorum]KAG4060596.1 hypothetical protein PC123_g4498 [Phytophthora cactorum]KAG4246186.1 hypothetical protein PC116_g6022 [Phytophthora cactorum]
MKAFMKVCKRGDSASSLQYFFSREEAINCGEAVKQTANGGFTHALQWVAQLPSEQSSWVSDFHGAFEAAKGGKLETVKWLHEHHGDKCLTGAMDHAAKTGI